MRFFELVRPNDAAPDQDFGPIPSLRHGSALSRVVDAMQSALRWNGQNRVRHRSGKTGAPSQRSLCLMRARGSVG